MLDYVNKGLISTKTKENLGPANPRAVPGDQLALWMW